MSFGFGLGFPKSAIAAGIQPALNLQFAGSQVLDPRITFTRASSATYFDSAGVLQRATYNLRSWSEAILTSNGYGSSSSTLSTVTISTPLSGVSTATLLVLNNGANTGDSNAGFNFSTASLANSTQYTQSIYAKSAGGTVLRIRNNSLGGVANFVLSGAGTAPGLVAGVQAASITFVGDGWYRCSWTFTTGTTAPGNRMDYWALKTDVNDGVGGLYVTGAQLEQASTAGPYWATTTAANGAPRFDYNPSTLAPLGLLIEEQRTNLLPYSVEFDNAAWSKSGTTVTANTTTSPDGTVNADSLVEDGGSSGHRVAQTISASSAVSYSVSFYIKQSGRSWARVLLDDNSGNGADAYFDLANGVIGSTNAIGVGASISSQITPVGSGWYRCSVTCVPSVTTTGSVRAFVSGTTGNATGTYTGTNGLTSIFIWGAQLEAGAFPTSYIPTTTAAATRAADNASMTGTNFSSWYNATEGTLYADVASANGNGARALTLSDGTINNQAWLREAGVTTSALEVYTSGSFVAQIGVVVAQPMKSAAAIKTNDFAVSVNGGSAATDTSGSVASYSQVNIGANYNASGSYLNGHIRRIAYFNTRLANANLQALTS